MSKTGYAIKINEKGRVVDVYAMSDAELNKKLNEREQEKEAKYNIRRERLMALHFLKNFYAAGCYRLGKPLQQDKRIQDLFAYLDEHLGVEDE